MDEYIQRVWAEATHSWQKNSRHTLEDNAEMSIRKLECFKTLSDLSESSQWRQSDSETWSPFGSKEQCMDLQMKRKNQRQIAVEAELEGVGHKYECQLASF